MCGRHIGQCAPALAAKPRRALPQPVAARLRRTITLSQDRLKSRDLALRELFAPDQQSLGASELRLELRLMYAQARGLRKYVEHAARHERDTNSCRCTAQDGVVRGQLDDSLDRDARLTKPVLEALAV